MESTFHSACVGVEPNQPIDIKVPAVLLAVTNGIIKHENGGNPYSPAIVAGGVRRALA